MTTTNLTPPPPASPEDLAEAILASRESVNQALIAMVESEATPPRKQATAATLLSLADRAAPPRSPPVAAFGERYELTDVGNGLVFADWNASDFRYCPPRGEWLSWDDRRWAPDDGETATQAAKRLSQVWLGKAVTISDSDARTRAVKHWLKTQSASGIRNMLTMASTEPGIVTLPAALDRDPWLLNVLSGTLDLQTGQLQAPDPADLITRLCPVEYRPDADQSEWLRFLERVVPDPAARTFLQRAAGYSLTGDTREEVLFFVCGPTASGKSTFAEAIKSVLGDYAATSDFETFLQRRATGGPRNDIARLDGARIVVSIEVDHGQRLAEGLVKIVTGGDTVAARLLYKESREFRPSFKLWLFANETPRAADNDGALWRRIMLVPFDVTIPEAERDPAVKARLRDPAVGGPAVMAWAVQGCLDWQRNGLQVPESVKRATQAYRMENDPLADWLKERCELTPAAETVFAELYKDYKGYAEAAGVRPITGKALGQRLEGMGLQRFVTSSGKRAKGYRGIGFTSMLAL